MKIQVGPVGQIVKGNVLDVNKEPLERALKDFDHQLYLKWNPKKNNKEGCWELRRRPDAKVPHFVCVYEGNTYCTMEYHESGINHVKDFICLDYKILQWIKTHDTWSQFNYSKDSVDNTNGFIRTMQLREDAKSIENLAKIRAETKYQLMQDRNAMKSYRNLVNSGTNPAEIARHWK